MFKIFEVFNSNNERLFFTTDKESVPINKEIETIINDGHKIKVNGKLLYKKDIAEFINNLD